jgi:hypothetical protein
LIASGGLGLSWQGLLFGETRHPNCTQMQRVMSVTWFDFQFLA